jgi:hypothetical protein
MPQRLDRAHEILWPGIDPGSSMGLMKRLTIACLALAFASQGALAQKGSASLAGRVVDSAGAPVSGASVDLTDLRRSTTTDTMGAFRFDSMSRGQWIVQVRKIGYKRQTLTADVDPSLPPLEVRLVSNAPTLVPVVTAASRLGLSGVVRDAGGKPVANARVRVLGANLQTTTDSAGSFWIAAPKGNHMVAVSKPSFAEKLAGVTIPADSGRDVAIWLRPAGSIPVDEAWNIEDLRERLAWARSSSSYVFTRESMEKEGFDWIYDAVQSVWLRMGRRGYVNTECMVVVNGGPETLSVSQPAVDDVESIEVYPRFPTQATARAAGPRRSSVPGGQFVERDNTRRAAMYNSALRNCLAVYVWLR